ncbi:hypothetical protein C8J57DRAFT_1245973 [Mycena rebaudengoi]|nr:hypothetical protein C8J57DRAFT_1245973 [Mycena rebaudengoi]
MFKGGLLACLSGLHSAVRGWHITIPNNELSMGPFAGNSSLSLPSDVQFLASKFHHSSYHLKFAVQALLYGVKLGKLCSGFCADIYERQFMIIFEEKLAFHSCTTLQSGNKLMSNMKEGLELLLLHSVAFVLYPSKNISWFVSCMRKYSVFIFSHGKTWFNPPVRNRNVRLTDLFVSAFESDTVPPSDSMVRHQLSDLPIFTRDMIILA